MAAIKITPQEREEAFQHVVRLKSAASIYPFIELDSLRDALNDFTEFVNDVAERLREEFSTRSDAWQSSDVGFEVNRRIELWEEFEPVEFFELDEDEDELDVEPDVDEFEGELELLLGEFADLLEAWT